MGPVFALCAPRSALVLESANNARSEGAAVSHSNQAPRSVGSIAVNACRMIGGPVVIATPMSFPKGELNAQSICDFFNSPDI